MRLLPIEAFSAVFEPLSGKRIGYIRPIGNVGDALIELAALRLFDKFHIRWRMFDPDEPGVSDVDELVFGGGGSMGTRYVNNWNLRGKILGLRLPITILPQSFTSPEDRPYKRVYVRERGSMALCPGAVLAPDLALSLERGAWKAPTRGTGVFLRRDTERTGGWRLFNRDPARICRTPQEYLELAASHERIITDRLHFAICGLLAGRETTLLPNDYHKNESMYQTWLKARGCRFAGNVREALKQTGKIAA